MYCDIFHERKYDKKYFAEDCDKSSWKNADIERVNEGREGFLWNQFRAMNFVKAYKNIKLNLTNEWRVLKWHETSK